MWFVQPLYVVSEFVTAAKVTAPYSFVDNTISDLSAATCTTVDYPHGPVPVCSPWHGLMNASFVVFGLLLLVGAVLLRRTLPSGVAATVSVVLWVVSGLSSIGTGLVPLDRDLALHSLLSLPVFLAQPVAIITLGVALRGRQRALALVVGVVSLVGTVAFLALTGSAEFGGLAERLALWPGYLWLPVAAWSLAADRSRIGLRHGV
ncbi:DUF998 domain-containing protein [Allorhizocola rhizosphaerae]|uniref:DUF998 domain-containing protein n=1 Tax=Allorhizocola rhizosphaerae TaxID=1872709 RepID=UPI000E3C7D09|nr:DUF998 domain-containing protein [Allorhizocola rhizosphaerae]